MCFEIAVLLQMVIYSPSVTKLSILNDWPQIIESDHIRHCIINLMVHHRLFGTFTFVKTKPWFSGLCPTFSLSPHRSPCSCLFRCILGQTLEPSAGFSLFCSEFFFLRLPYVLCCKKNPSKILVENILVIWWSFHDRSVTKGNYSVLLTSSVIAQVGVFFCAVTSFLYVLPLLLPYL